MNKLIIILAISLFCVCCKKQNILHNDIKNVKLFIDSLRIDKLLVEANISSIYIKYPDYVVIEYKDLREDTLDFQDIYHSETHPDYYKIIKGCVSNNIDYVDFQRGYVEFIIN